MITASSIRSLPKAELHVHLEGTIEPAELLGYAARNQVTLPWSSPAEVEGAFDYTGLDSFLALYWQGCQVLRTRADFHDLAFNYLRRAAAQGVARVELSFAPQNFLPRGIRIDDQLGGLREAMSRARSEFGIDSAVIVVVQRHKPESEAYDLLELISPYQPEVVGVGLGGPERDHPPSKFAGFFAAAKGEGHRLTAHAGEEGPPDYVREAIDVCGVERIDHGFTAATDAELLRSLAADQIPLTLCPLSNLRLGVTRDLTRYPLHRFLDAGVAVSINSDDPPYFGGSLTDNYLALSRALDLDADTIGTLARNSIVGSFASPSAKTQLLATSGV